jgi:hypothetical protein
MPHIDAFFLASPTALAGIGRILFLVLNIDPELGDDRGEDSS